MVKTIPGLSLSIVPSRWQSWLSCLAYAGALVSPFLAAIPIWQAWLVVAGVAVYWGYCRAKPNPMPLALTLLTDGRCLLVWAHAEEVTQLQPGVICTPWLIVIPLLGERKLRLLLWPDSAPPSQLRQLRGRLRWGRSKRP